MKSKFPRSAINVAVLSILLIGGGGYVCESQDLSTFDLQESYVVEGTSVIVTQKIGQAAVELTARVPAQAAAILATANGAAYNREFAYPHGLTIYRLETNSGPISATSSSSAISSLNSDANIRYAYPVYVNPNTGFRLFLNDEIAVRLKTNEGLQDTNLTQPFQLKFVSQVSQSENIYLFKLRNPKNFNPFKVCNAIRALTNIVWAEPNFAQDGRALAIPNDPEFSQQWHLRNTGQTGAFSGADVDAADAWDASQGYGSPGIRIAVVDDGVQMNHPDLSDNLVDGYDFYSDDSDPDPDGTYDNHGTSVAGLAAAAVNNSNAVAGVAGKCQILPVRLFYTHDSQGDSYFPPTATIYRALVYAADNADVMSCSWEVSSASMISDGFSYASTSSTGSGSGRGGYGCPVFCSSGNSAGGSGSQGYTTARIYDLYSILGAAGNYFLGFQYDKDGSGSAGDDTVWLADITLPDGTKQRLDSGTLPSGWQNYGDANWTTSIDPAHAHGTTRYAWRAGTIDNSQVSGIATSLLAIDSTTHRYVTLRRWISSQTHDNFHLAFFNSSGTYLGYYPLDDSGVVQNRTTAVTYPANLSSTLAVGATSDFDYRAHFSQYGSTLTFVAPGGGGYDGLATTDRTGSDGYGSGDYITGFEGTSASAPIAAGIAALVLSRDGKQWASTVATKLESTCDKVGPVTYSGSPYTRNDYYGYGRLNAYSAVSAATADTTAPTFVSATVINHRAVDVAFSEPMGEGSLDPNNYSITAGAGTLSTHPDDVIRIGNVTVGYNNRRGTCRLIWSSGEIATSGTVTIAASSSVKDVAGNAVTGTLSKSGTGTKRIIGVDCGSPDEFTYYQPFLSDNGFQGNEADSFFSGTIASQQSYGTSINTSGVSDPAPQGVYQSWRYSYDADTPESFTYTIPDLPANDTVRIHLTNINTAYGWEIFDVYINGNYKGSFYGGGTSYAAHVLEYTSSTVSGNNTVEIVPEASYYDGAYRAYISGIEVVKP